VPEFLKQSNQPPQTEVYQAGIEQVEPSEDRPQAINFAHEVRRQKS